MSDDTAPAPPAGPDPIATNPSPQTADALSAGPEPMSHGTYAVFEKPDGGVHLAVRVLGELEDRHLDLPGPMVAMAKRMLSEGVSIPGMGIIGKWRNRHHG